MKTFKSIRALKNKEKGRRAFILANGPSISRENLSLLKDELTIGMNASTLLEAEFDFSSDYYVLSDTRFITHPEKHSLSTTMLNPKTIRILRAELESYDDISLKDRTYYIKALKRDGFSENLAAGFFFGCTTTMLAIQLSHYLGCTEVYLLGCDLRYSNESPRFYKELTPQLEDSFTSVQIWNIANAGNLFSSQNRKLINCSERSFLRPHIEYTPFDSLFNNTKNA